MKYHINPWTGNEANSGETWEKAKKWINLSLQPGDEVKIALSETPIFTPPAGNQFIRVQSIKGKGTKEAPIVITGGWNPQTDLVESQTIFDGQNLLGVGLWMGGNEYMIMEGISLIHYFTGFSLYGSYYCKLNIPIASDCSHHGIYLVQSALNTIRAGKVENSGYSNLYLHQLSPRNDIEVESVSGGRTGITMEVGSDSNVIKCHSSSDHIASGLYLYGVFDNTITVDEMKRNMSALRLMNSHDNHLHNTMFAENVPYDIETNAGTNYLDDCRFDGEPKILLNAYAQYGSAKIYRDIVVRGR